MNVYWLDGVFHEAHTAPAFEGVEGVFDTLLANNGVACYGEEHRARLMHDARAVLHVSPDIPDVMPALLRRATLNVGFARVRTSIMVNHIMMEAVRCPDPKSLPPLTCAVITDYPRIAGSPLENCKRRDYTRNFAAREKAQALGADEAIVTNTRGHIACGATSNLFIEEQGRLVTPPLSEGVLAGVTRRMILADGHATEEIITHERLRSADAVYLTNSIFGKRPVAAILP